MRGRCFRHMEITACLPFRPSHASHNVYIWFSHHVLVIVRLHHLMILLVCTLHCEQASKQHVFKFLLNSLKIPLECERNFSYIFEMRVFSSKPCLPSSGQPEYEKQKGFFFSFMKCVLVRGKMLNISVTEERHKILKSVN